MPRFNQLKAGDQLWDCRGRNLGVKAKCVPVLIMAIDHEKLLAQASFDGEPPITITLVDALKLSWIPASVRGRCAVCCLPRVRLARKYRDIVRGSTPYCKCTPMPRKVVHPASNKVERL